MAFLPNLKRGMKEMKKLEFAVAASLVVCTVVAMPNRQEIAKARPLVAELMTPVVAAYKAKTKTVIEVADAAKGFSGTAKSEAAKYLLLKGAASYYIKGHDFDKAISIIEDIKANVKDVPPSEIADTISKALDNDTLSKSPRLQSLLLFAKAQAQAGTDVKRLSAEMKKVCTDPIRRKYAEAVALTSDWKSAIRELVKVYGNIGKMAKADADGSADPAALGDFWWEYEASYAGMERVFRGRAVAYYRKAIAEGKIDRLKMPLVQQRLASFAQQDVYRPVADFSLKDDAALSPFAVKNTSGIFARWSFDEDFKDSISGIMPVKSEKAQLANGAVTLQAGFPMEFPAGSVPFAPFTVQLWTTMHKHGDTSEDMIFRIAPTADNRDERIFLKASHCFGDSASKPSNKWFQGFCAFKSYSKQWGNEKNYYDGKQRLITVTGENTEKGMIVNYYENGKHRKSFTTPKTWSTPPMLILGGSVPVTYSEVRVYLRTLTQEEIAESRRLGPNKLPGTSSN